MQNIKRLFQAPPQSFFLLGPRGTGKTTWIRENFKDAVRISIYEIFASLMGDENL